MSTVHTPLSVALTRAHPFVAPAVWLSNSYAFIVARLSSAMRPQGESPAEAADRLRLRALRAPA